MSGTTGLDPSQQAQMQQDMQELGNAQVSAMNNNTQLSLQSIQTNEFETALQTAEGLAMNAAKNKPQV